MPPKRVTPQRGVEQPLVSNMPTTRRLPRYFKDVPSSGEAETSTLNSSGLEFSLRCDFGVENGRKMLIYFRNLRFFGHFRIAPVVSFTGFNTLSEFPR